MQISFSTRHGHLAPETQAKIGQKIEKLGRFHDKISVADVTVDLKEAKQPKIEIRVAVDGSPSFVAQTSGNNLLGAVEGAVHKLEEQLKKHKEKLVHHSRDPARKRTTFEIDGSEPDKLSETS